MKKTFLTICLLVVSMIVLAQIPKYAKVKISLGTEGLKEIAALGIPVDAGEYKKDNYFIAELSQQELIILDNNAISYEVLIADMTAFYSERNQHPENTKDNDRADDCETPVNIVTPEHFVLGSVGGFYTLAELYAQLDSMRVHFPDLITARQQIGSILSTEGRPVYSVKLSDNADTDEAEPEVLYAALNHAREPMGMQQLVFFMWYLLENYSTDDEIKQLLDHTELYFVPCVNPDGYNYNCVNNPDGGGMWRKNIRDNGDGSTGVDLNRNYGYEWGYDDFGSSPDPSSDTYRGATAFSEPETQAVKWFCEHRNFILAIDYHCYGNFLLYPWGYTAGLETPDSLLYRAFSQLMIETNAYATGTPDATVGYAANGASLDWYYGEQATKNKILLFSPEAGDADDGFWPAISRIEEIAKVNVEQNLYIARFAGIYASAKDISPAFVSQQNDYFNFEISRLGLAEPATFTISIEGITPNIVSVGSAHVYSSLAMLETRVDSISFGLSAGLQSGEKLQFLLTVDNGLYSVSDTITKMYGLPMIAFNDDCNSIGNWIADGWGVCTTTYHAPSGSIADSPSGNYSDNAYNSISLSSEFDLSNSAGAVLSFWAKWDIESDFDYVQLAASSDGGISWTPLCGKYTNPGTPYQLQDEPLYDGLQPDWVLEEINLDNFLGQQVILQFTLGSDGYLNKDGFYFDEMTVTKINNEYTEINDADDGNFVSEPYPNPAENSFSVTYSLNDNTPEFKILNAMGQIVGEKKLTEMSGQVSFDLSGFCPGVYFYMITSGQFISALKKLIVVR